MGREDLETTINASSLEIQSLLLLCVANIWALKHRPEGRPGLSEPTLCDDSKHGFRCWFCETRFLSQPQPISFFELSYSYQPETHNTQILFWTGKKKIERQKRIPFLDSGLSTGTIYSNQIKVFSSSQNSVPFRTSTNWPGKLVKF